ncbi:hypothetical protein [Rheinheimera sp. MM224]|uniref:hypothetical protein n=1 Tax=Rheinheimera sp. MM224 TaxID=3019969 RepID=UPI0021F8EF11|nr:hypothetical protein [Rheinheimera sp. MM224]CAI3806449.1 hypothetical protein JAMGFMIE_04185 [Rheinheimera sp. MM224]
MLVPFLVNASVDEKFSMACRKICSLSRPFHFCFVTLQANPEHGVTKDEIHTRKKGWPCVAATIYISANSEQLLIRNPLQDDDQPTELTALFAKGRQSSGYGLVLGIVHVSKPGWIFS